MILDSGLLIWPTLYNAVQSKLLEKVVTGVLDCVKLSGLLFYMKKIIKVVTIVSVQRNLETI